MPSLIITAVWKFDAGQNGLFYQYFLHAQKRWWQLSNSARRYLQLQPWNEARLSWIRFDLCFQCTLTQGFQICKPLYCILICAWEKSKAAKVDLTVYFMHMTLFAFKVFYHAWNSSEPIQDPSGPLRTPQDPSGPLRTPQYPQDCSESLRTTQNCSGLLRITA